MSCCCCMRHQWSNILVFTEPNIADENHDVESLATHEFLLNAVATVSAAHVQVAMEIMPTLVHHLEQLLTESRCCPLVVKSIW